MPQPPRGPKQNTMGTSASGCNDCSKNPQVDVEVTSIQAPKALQGEQPDARGLQAQVNVAPGAQRSKELRRSQLLRNALVPDFEILRGLSVQESLRGFGRLWRFSPTDLSEESRAAMWQRSRPLESFDLFLSHTWRTKGLWKFLALSLQCGWQRLVLSWFLALVLVEILVYFDILPLHMNFTVPW